MNAPQKTIFNKGRTLTEKVLTEPVIEPTKPTASQAEPSPVIERFQTLDHPTIAAQLVWVAGQELPFVVPLKLLDNQTERFQPLLELNVGDPAPLGLLADAHKEAANFFPPEVAQPAELERGAKALEQIRAENDSRRKAKIEAEAEAKGLDEKLAKETLDAAINKIKAGKVSGNGFLAQLLNAFQEGRIEGLMAGHQAKQSVKQVAAAGTAMAASVARKVGHVKEIGAQGVKTLASTIRREPVVEQSKAPVKVDVDKIAAQGMLEPVEFFNTVGSGAKAKVNVELKVLSHSGKGGVVRFTDAAGTEIGAAIAKANNFPYDAKTGAVTLEGKTVLKSAQDMVVKLVVPVLEKAGMYRISVSYGARVTPDVAELYRHSQTKGTAKKHESSIPQAPKKERPERER